MGQFLQDRVLDEAVDREEEEREEVVCGVCAPTMRVGTRMAGASGNALHANKSCSSKSVAANRARLAQNSVGTKHFVTRLLNQRLLHVVKSVTTVAKLMGSILPVRMRRLSMRRGMCCMSGCTEMTRSGL
jgi:hypothetical protein